MMNNNYSIQVIKDLLEFDDAIECWKEFYCQNKVRRALAQDPEIIRLKLEQNKGRVLLNIIIIRKKGIECIAPFYIDRTQFRLKFSVLKLPKINASLLKLFGNNIIYSENADKKFCNELIFKLLNFKSVGYDFAVIENLDPNNEIIEYLSSPNGKANKFKITRVSQIQNGYKHVLEQSYEEWQNSLSGKVRRNMRWEMKNINNKISDGIKIERITNVNQVDEFLNKVNEIFGKTWQAQTFGIKVRNTQDETRYFKELARNGWLRSYLLLSKENAIAFIIGTQYNDIFDYSEIGYNPNYKKYSPGSVLSYHMVEDLYEYKKPKMIDFGFGENLYKKKLGNDVEQACNYYLIPRNKWMIIHFLQVLLDHFYLGLTRLIEKLNCTTRIRNILKNKR